MKEPILIIVGGGTALVEAILQVLVAAGVPISTPLHGAITTLAGVLLASYGRTHVTPVASLPPGVAAKIADNNAKG